MLSEHVGLHIIELPKFALGEDEIATLEEVWCYFLRHADSLDTDRMPAAMNKPLVMKAMEVLVKMSQDAVERERYESRLKWERDQRQREKDQRQRENDAKKREEDARKEGLELGAYYGEISTLQLVLKRPETPKQELAKLSLDELRRLADELKQQITAR